jgi:hypothetical protein
VFEMIAIWSFSLKWVLLLSLLLVELVLAKKSGCTCNKRVLMIAEIIFCFRETEEEEQDLEEQDIENELDIERQDIENELDIERQDIEKSRWRCCCILRAVFL